MKKETIRAVAAAVILLILYHLVVFLLPFAKTTVFWISYLFTLVSFGVAALSIYISFIKAPNAMSRFYNFPIARLGVGYCITQSVLGLIAMALGALIPGWVAVLVYAIKLGAALLGLISAETVVETVIAQDAKLKKDVTMLRGLQSKVSQMAAQSDDPALKALAEEFRYSDPVSSEDIAEAEAELSAIIDVLQGAFVDGDNAAVTQLCRRASVLLAERNRLCKLNKQ